MEKESIRVLLVDDDRGDYLIIRQLLARIENRSMLLDWVAAYDEAVEAIHRQSHDVYLVDYHLGARTGLELLGQVVASGCLAPLILLTGAGERELDLAAIAVGAADYLDKQEITAPLLERSIRFAIERKHVELALQQANDELEARVRERTSELSRANAALQEEIDRRRRTERSLRRSERQLRQLADAMPQIVWAARADGHLDYCNRRWYEFTNLPVGRGGDESWTPLLHPDDVERCLDSWHGAVRSGEPYEIEYRFWDQKSGRYRWHLGRALPIYDEQGRVTRWFGTCTDIDDQKLALEQLALADRRKDAFLAMIAHELRNPLNVISNAAHLIGGYMEKDSPVRGPQKIVERQAKHMTRLIDDLLDVARIAEGKMVLDSIRLDLVRLVRDVSEDQRSLMLEKDLRLIVDLPRSPVMVKGDPTRLWQIVGNLLQNAAKFTDHGGEVEVRVVVNEEACSAALSVRDNGAGIALEMLAQVFEPFAQATRTVVRSHGGLGVGLAVVKGIVELHGGAVQAMSDGPECGSTFTVMLPLDINSAREPERFEMPAGGSTGLKLQMDEKNRAAAG